VRGYGLVDSPKVETQPGRLLNLTAVLAPSEAALRSTTPAIYWYSMLEIPPASEFGGHTRIPKERTQADWLKQVKNIGCIGCHQLGQASTRTLPPRSRTSSRPRRRGCAASSRVNRASR
jgi:hypothetical protein